MHWCAYPSPTHRLRNSKTNQYILQPRVVKTVGVTGKISKWQLENRLQKCSHCSFSKTQVFHRHRRASMGAKLAIRILFAMYISRKTVKVNASANQQTN